MTNLTEIDPALQGFVNTAVDQAKKSGRGPEVTLGIAGIGWVSGNVQTPPASDLYNEYIYLVNVTIGERSNPGPANSALEKRSGVGNKGTCHQLSQVTVVEST